ncbi:MAG: GNAT family N-acetyltransferase [Candidatus Melainabacteria bacterium]|nr:GNAT family N-acetyltransferase [Candidatus Melainabacteria bacterium]
MTRETLKIESLPNQMDLAAVSAMLNEHNADQGLVYDPRALNIFVRDERGNVIAGLIGSTYWDWLRISKLAVARSARDQGLGTRLLQAAEEEASKRGCSSVFVDTFSFQAINFYKSLGYKVFAELPDYPKGHIRYFLTKKLEP